MATQYINVQSIASGFRSFVPAVTGGAVSGLLMFIGGVDRSKYISWAGGGTHTTSLMGSSALSSATSGTPTAAVTIQSQTIGRWSMNFDLQVGDSSFTPETGDTVLFLDQGARIFAGCITEVITERHDWTQESIVYHCVATDKAGICDHRRIVGKTYLAGQDVASVILDIVTNFLNGEGITTGGVPQDGTLGVLAADLKWNFPTVTQAFDTIGTISGTVWWIDEYFILHFSALANLPAAPFSLTETSYNWRNLKVTKTTSNYYNRLYAVTNLNIVPGGGTGGPNTIFGHGSAYRLDGTHHPIVNTAFTEPFAPFRVGDALYVWSADPITGNGKVYKSTTGGRSWFEQDVAHEPTNADTAWFHGSTIVMATTDEITSPWTRKLVNFDCLTNTWGSTYGSTQSMGSDGIINSVRVRSNGNVVIVFPTVVAGNKKLNYAEYSGSWSAAAIVNSLTATYIDFTVILDTKDGLSFVYNKARDDATYVRRLSSANVLGSETRVDTAISDTIYTFGYGCIFGGNIYIPYYFDGSVYPQILIGTPFDAPVWSKQIVDPTKTGGAVVFVNATVINGLLTYTFIQFGSGIPNLLWQAVYNGGWQPSVLLYDSNAFPPTGVPRPTNGYDMEGLSATQDGIAVGISVASSPITELYSINTPLGPAGSNALTEQVTFTVGQPGVLTVPDGLGGVKIVGFQTSVGIGSVTSMTVNGFPQTVIEFSNFTGQTAATPTDYLWFFGQGDNELFPTTIPPAGSIIVVTYVPFVSTNASAAQFGTALAPNAGGTCGSGVYEGVVQVQNISSQSSLNAIAAAELKKLGGLPTVIDFQTFTPGLKPGQLLHVDVPLSNVPSIDLLVTQVNGVFVPPTLHLGGSFDWTVQARSNLDPGNAAKWFENLIARTNNPLPVLQYEAAPFILSQAQPVIVTRTGLLVECLLVAATPPVNQTLNVTLVRNGVAISATLTLMPPTTLANQVLNTQIANSLGIYLIKDDVLTINTSYTAIGGGPVAASGVSFVSRWAM